MAARLALPAFPAATYSRRAYDLARFGETPADGVIATFVRATAVLEAMDRAALRSGLTPDETYLLLCIARRRAAAALRQRELALALEAIQALTLVDREKIDFRDLSVDFPLLAYRELGGDLDSVVDWAV